MLLPELEQKSLRDRIAKNCMMDYWHRNKMRLAAHAARPRIMKAPLIRQA